VNIDLSRIDTLNRHYPTCKELNVYNLFKKTQVMKNEIQQLKQETEDLKKQITISNTGTANIVGVNNGNMDNSVNTINITLNSYDKPFIDKSMFTESQLKHLLKKGDSIEMIKTITEIVYRNPECPQNHSIYVPNIKTNRVMIYDENQWKSIESISNISDVLSNTAYDVYAECNIDDDEGIIYIKPEQKKKFSAIMKHSLHKQLT